MSINTTIASLSQTVALNGPDGAVDPPSSLDDSLRYHGAFIAMLRDGQGHSAEATVASAATADIGAATSPFVQITGTTTITSFGANYNGPRFIRFAGALTLTHSASTLILPGAANITTAAGDTCIAVPIGSPGSGWQVLAYRRASTPTNGSVIDRAYAEYTANANLTTIIPVDDTIPQNTEGTQIISVSFTPKSATSRIRLRFQGEAASGTAPVGIAAAIFSSASANAIAAKNVSAASSDNSYLIVIETEYVPGVTTALTYSVRVGPSSAATVRMNGTSITRLLGGTQTATLVIEEIAA